MRPRGTQLLLLREVGKKKNSSFLGFSGGIRVYVGDRSHKGAQGLWKTLPGVYRQCAVSYSDFWSAYEEVFPSKRHQSVGKSSGKTSYIEKDTGGELLRLS